MGLLWTPPTVSRELQDNTRAFIAEIAASARRDAICDYWDAELQKIDPKLTIIQAQDNAEAVGLRPGYWHIIRDCTPGPPSILPLIGPEGEFVEPNSSILDMLREGDLQNERAMEARRKQDEESARRRVRDRERAHEDRVGEMMERWEHVMVPKVGMSGNGWTASVDGRRGAKKD